MGILITPSVLNADLSDLAGELRKIRDADMVHLDVMDNHFVPNLTVGLPVVEAVVRRGVLPVDAHLMIADPDRWAPAYAEAGCESVTFHAEAAAAPVVLAREIRAQGARACLALRPATDIATYEDLLGEFDQILIMTVEPGFGGQAFLESMLPKIERTRAAITRRGLQVRVQVDGGISVDTIERAAAAGADVFVAGSAVFRADDAAAEVQRLRELAQGACAHTP